MLAKPGYLTGQSHQCCQPICNVSVADGEHMPGMTAVASSVTSNCNGIALSQLPSKLLPLQHCKYIYCGGDAQRPPVQWKQTRQGVAHAHAGHLPLQQLCGVLALLCAVVFVPLTESSPTHSCDS